MSQTANSGHRTARPTAHPWFVAEVSSNHSRELERCLRFVDAAADCGCDAVKFQYFRIEELFAPEVLEHSPEHRARKAWELPREFLAPIAARCREQGLQFGCTPFFLAGVGHLAEHVDFFKIASYELLWHDLLRACAATGKPVVLSTGLADMAEIGAALAALQAGGCIRPTLLHCVSGYPTPPEQANLAALETLRQAFGVPVGWSDHTASPAVLYRAVHRWGAVMIELHLDLDGQGAEFAAGHCWLPGPLAEVIATIRQGCEADGDGVKRCMPEEAADRYWRADPADGLRPLRGTRRNCRKNAKEGQGTA